MPFDGLPDGLLSDLAKLKVALAGVSEHWRRHELGAPDSDNHCALGWLLAVTDWDVDEATRLALDYVYPALPRSARRVNRVRAIYSYNDDGERGRVVKLFQRAVALASRRAASD